MKTILITGANGFIGKNLVVTLRTTRPDLNFLLYDVQHSLDDLRTFVRSADFVFHLAGVNRPQSVDEFTTGNVGLTEQLIELLVEQKRTSGHPVPLMVSSSIQSLLDNPYGLSKRQAEEAVFAYGEQTGAPVFVYRFPNVFGKWCRPNYNSAVATFCHNIAHDLPITVNDPTVVMSLVYIDDVVEELLRALDGKATQGESAGQGGEQGGAKGAGKSEGQSEAKGVVQVEASTTAHQNRYCVVPVMHTVTLGEIVDRIRSFKDSRTDRSVPDMSDPFTRKLYSTYLSYLPTDQFSYPLKMNVDARGSFTEFLKTPDRGQVSVNISRPGIVKGNHWHHSKNEKFLVVSGRGVVRFRKIDSRNNGNGASESEDKSEGKNEKFNEVIEYYVSGDKLEVVDIPTGYTHNIENLGDTDMVTVMWANEAFDPAKPDTYYEVV